MTYTRDEKNYWRSLEDIRNTEKFKTFLEHEFAEIGKVNSVNRRKFLSLMGASFAFAGLVNCRRPVEKIVPHVTPPEDSIPGVPLYYNTTMPFFNDAFGLRIKSYDGRPIKIEGNPDHPSTQGASNSYLQAEILNLYNPDRSKHCYRAGIERSWDEFVPVWQELYPIFIENRGQGLAVLSNSFSSPTMTRLAETFRRRFPKSRWVVFDPVSDEKIYKGIKSATGRDLFPIYHYEKAKIILSLDSDLLFSESRSIVNAKGFAQARHVQSPQDEMNRLYVVEGTLTLTGGMADHRLCLPDSQVGLFAAALVTELKSRGLNIPGTENVTSESREPFDDNWLKALGDDLLENRGRSIVVAGRGQSIAVHALVMSLNAALGNNGETIEYRVVSDEFTPDASELAKLKYDIDQGEISCLIMFGGNPLFDATLNLDFNSIDTTIHLSHERNETSLESTWHIPQSHFLEQWGDAVAIDGTASLIQPLIEPLYGGKSAFELLNLVVSGKDSRGYDIVRETWGDMLPHNNFESSWREVLHNGIAPRNSKTVVPGIQASGVRNALDLYPVTAEMPNSDGLELVFKASSHVFDGRYAANAWLLENPDPITKLTWDNAALMSPATAESLNLKNNDVITLTVEKKQLDVPIWIVPGYADYLIALPLGFGRTAAGAVGSKVGVNPYPLRSYPHSYIEKNVKVRNTKISHPLASTQDHGSMEGRPLVREATLSEYKSHPHFAHKVVEHPPLKSMWKEHQYDEGYQWGMTVDLNACIGCGACTVACQSENNIAVVGKEQVAKGREMHWLRIDRYFEGYPEHPSLVFQPVACQHCELAPCEGVCPVAATVHDNEGLNLMVYNRCVGTRYCSNNCPFKVRRFNFFNYIKDYSDTMKMAQNPNVTVRTGGVMEKCTYCLQRINEAKQGKETIEDGDIKTACQQACPTQAIQFGNILDPESSISKSMQLDRSYGMLSELNLKTRTKYLAKLRNPNPNLEGEQPA